MAVENRVVDYATGLPADEIAAQLNALGATGWKLLYLVDMTQTKRRAYFVQGSGGMIEYMVSDFTTGEAADYVEGVLDALGADGWMLAQIDMLKQNQRRAIYMRGPGTSGGGGTGGGIEEAPLDGITYGRRNAGWNPALALTNDVLDGGSF